MGVEGFKERARALVQEVQVLTAPMSELADGQWSEEVGLSADEQRDLGDLGTVQLNGEIKAALTLTRRHAAPEHLDTIAAEPEETENAIASATFIAEAGAQLNHQQPIAAGAGITLGAEAAGRLAVGQHRRYALSDSGLSTLRDLLSHVRNPYSVDSLGELAEGELFGIELSGHGQLSAAVGWQAGIVRSFEGTKLEELAGGDLGGFTADLTAAFTVQAKIEGEMRALVDRSPRDPNQVRVRLLRKHGNFIGAGLKLTAAVKWTQDSAFVDTVFDRLLRLPDGLVGRLERIEQRLAEAQEHLNGLADEARAAIANAAGTVTDTLGLDDLVRIRSEIEELPNEIGEVLAPILGVADEIQETIDESREELIEFVDDLFAQAAVPFEQLASKLETWLDAYRQARQRAVELVKQRAEQGVTAELTAGINRTRTSEVLLELDFVLQETGLLCIEAMKGNFTPALERAQTPGATGVEIIAGSLKRTTKKTRYYNLRLNLFGFNVKVDFQRWSQVEVETDAKTGAISIFGKAGASLSAETNRRRNSVNFLFDVYGSFEQQGNAILTSPSTDFKATLVRGAEFEQASRIRPLIRRHLQGARRLGLLDIHREAELLEVLFKNTSSKYSYELQLGFPPSSFERMFCLDRSEPTKQLRNQIWDWMRQATEALDIPLDLNKPEAMLSDMYVGSVIDFVRQQPILLPGNQVPAPIQAVRPGGEILASGAYQRAWAYLRNAHFFVEGYLRTREYLQAQRPLKDVSKRLSKIAAKAITGAGALNLQPFDAKYLTFVLAEGLRETEISMTLQRGITVTI